MKKLWFILLVTLVLSGCGGKDDYETRMSPCDATAAPAPGQISIHVPDFLSAPVMTAPDGDRIYIADDYTVCLQTMHGGNLNATLKSCTGFDMEKLTVLQTQKDGLKRYDCAWSSTGEGDQTIGRLTVLDDGDYHYVLSVTAAAAAAEELSSVWQQLSDSFQVNIAQ